MKKPKESTRVCLHCSHTPDRHAVEPVCRISRSLNGWLEPPFPTVDRDGGQARLDRGVQSVWMVLGGKDGVWLAASLQHSTILGGSGAIMTTSQGSAMPSKAKPRAVVQGNSIEMAEVNIAAQVEPIPGGPLEGLFDFVLEWGIS